jgi:FtsP/CotA-like multicopper oxidase with cupredoxin domain
MASPWRVAADEPLLLVPMPSSAPLYGGTADPTPIWGYQGRVPGPVIRVRRGERVRVRLRNGLVQPTTVHWHGIRLDNAMDGVPGLTQAPVPPGQDFEYAFDVPDAGTFWYHPHHRSWEQMARGLYGLLIVEEDEPPAVDREIAFVADDWRLDKDGKIDEESFGNMRDWSHAGRLGNWLTINSRSAPEVPVRAGERIRLRCLNAANSRVFVFDFDREKLRPHVIAWDEQPVAPEAVAAGGLVLAPAQRADLLIDVAGEPGTSVPFFEVSMREKVEAARFVIGAGAPLRKALADPISLPPNPLPGGLDTAAAQSINLLMEGGAMGGMREAMYQGKMFDIRELADMGKVWSFNGVIGRSREPLARIPKGRTAVIDMVNRTAWPHAMHLHGHHFRVVERAGKKVTGAPWRDTELVRADEQVKIAFVADISRQVAVPLSHAGTPRGLHGDLDRGGLTFFRLCNRPSRW